MTTASSVRSALLGLLLISPTTAQEPAGAAQNPNRVEDAPLEPYRRELLQLAFDAASKFPPNPHKKNRGRAQELVVVACFELDQPLLALGFAPRVEGWRRGMAYADFAFYSARRGISDRVDRYLKLAEAVVAQEQRDPTAQQWRTDKIKLKMARALHALGRVDEAQALAAQIDASSSGAVDADWSRTMSERVAALTPKTARQELERVTETFLDQVLGEQYTSLMLLSGMHGRFFADTALREACEERIVARFTKLPANLRLDAMAPLVEHHVDAGEREGAREVLRRMTELVDNTRWRTEDLLPQLARLAELRVRVGDRERAEKELDDALARYHEDRDEIVDIYRCETLRPLALAWHALGKHEFADGLLQTALEEGVENPNSRPRCFDLVETCVAMAMQGAKPSEALWTRMREIRDALGEPW